MTKTAMCLAIMALALTACGEPSPRGAHQDKLQGKLTITGSSTLAPLVLEVAKRFETEYPAVRIDVQTGGSSRGIADVRRGTAHIGMVSRAIEAGESDLVAYQIASDGVCIILHRDNPIEELTDEEVVQIYTGVVTNWMEVGGWEAPITVVNKAEGRATLAVFLEHFGLESPSIRPDVVIGENEEGIKTVAGNRNAIGYVSIGTAEYDAQQGIPIKLLPSNGVSASTSTVAHGTFPIARPLNLVTKRKPGSLTKAFLEYSQSEKIHDLIASHYFVPTVP